MKIKTQKLVTVADLARAWKVHKATARFNRFLKAQGVTPVTVTKVARGQMYMYDSSVLNLKDEYLATCRGKAKAVKVRSNGVDPVLKRLEELITAVYTLRDRVDLILRREPTLPTLPDFDDQPKQTRTS